MLVSCCHPQIFMAQQERDGMNIRACHPHPTSGGVPQVVEVKVFNPQ
jgi:hypothetical protein